MRIGLSSRSFPVNMSIPQGLRLTKRAGFDCVELDISEAGYLTLESDRRSLLFLRNAVENMSLETGSVRAGVLRDLPISSDYAFALKKCIEICHALGTSNASLPAGCTGLGTEVFADINGIAREAGVALALENGSESELALTESAGYSYAGICIDTGDAGTDEPVEARIRSLGKRLKLVRARDYRACACGEILLTNILEGEVNWKEVRRALLETGYEGPVIAEVAGYRQYADLGIKHCGEQMKRVFGPVPKGRE